MRRALPAESLRAPPRPSPCGVRPPSGVSTNWLGGNDGLQANREARAADIDGAAGFQRHSALVAEKLRLLGAVADRSTLMLEPEASLHHTIAAVVDSLPKLGEPLGQ